MFTKPTKRGNQQCHGLEILKKIWICLEFILLYKVDFFKPSMLLAKMSVAVMWRVERCNIFWVLVQVDNFNKVTFFVHQLNKTILLLSDPMPDKVKECWLETPKSKNSNIVEAALE